MVYLNGDEIAPGPVHDRREDGDPGEELHRVVQDKTTPGTEIVSDISIFSVFYFLHNIHRNIRIHLRIEC